VECLGGGGGGSRAGGLAAGGGGSAYAKIASTTTPLAPGTLVAYSVGSGGIGQTALDASGFDGTPTVWNATSLADAVSKGSAVACAADAGKGGTTLAVGAGGLASASVGTTTFDGGAGNRGNLSSCGGGGAAGPNGAGGDAPTGFGGDADNGTVAGGAPTAPGNSGTEFDATHGCGSGAGPQHTNNNAGNATGGKYGGGGGGVFFGATSSGAGGAGLIVITYEQSIGGEYILTGGDGSFTIVSPFAFGSYVLTGRPATFATVTGTGANLNFGRYLLTGGPGTTFLNTTQTPSPNILGPLPPLTARWVNDPDGSPAQIWRQYLLSLDAQVRALMGGNFGTLPHAANDLAAAAAGVKIGGLYQSGGAVFIRLT
jgi:hypothetical protein